MTATTTTDLDIFTYADGTELRTACDGDEVIVCLADLAHGLGIKQITPILRRLPDGVTRNHPIQDRLGRTQQATFVTEAGMNMVIWRSDKPAAVAYAQWCAERIAELRRHGMTATDDAVEAMLADPDSMIRALTALKEERAARAAAEAENRVLEPKARSFDHFLSSGDDYSVATVAQALVRAGASTGRNRLFGFMEHLGWIYRPEGHRQWRAYQSAVEAGLVRVRMGKYEGQSTGEVRATYTIRVTPKGLDRLAGRFGVNVSKGDK